MTLTIPIPKVFKSETRRQLDGLRELLVSPVNIRLGAKRAFIAPKYYGLIEVDITALHMPTEMVAMKKLTQHVYVFGTAFEVTRNKHDLGCVSDEPSHVGYVIGTELLDPRPSPNMAQFDQIRYLPGLKQFINCRTGDAVIRADVLFMKTMYDTDGVSITGVDTRVIETWKP